MTFASKRKDTQEEANACGRVRSGGMHAGMAGARGRGAMWVLGCRVVVSWWVSRLVIGEGNVERRGAPPLRWVAGPSAPNLF